MKETFSKGITMSWTVLVFMICILSLGFYGIILTQNIFYVAGFLLIPNLFLSEKIVEIDYDKNLIRESKRILFFKIGKWIPLTDFDFMIIKDRLEKENYQDCSQCKEDLMKKSSLALINKDRTKKIELVTGLKDQLIKIAKRIETNSCISNLTETQLA